MKFNGKTWHSSMTAGSILPHGYWNETAKRHEEGKSLHARLLGDFK